MKPIDKIVKIEAGRPDQNSIQRAAHVLQKGGMVVYPTSGLYGLGVSALDAQAMERVFRLKGRDRGKPLLALVADMPMLEKVARPPDNAVRHLMSVFWPGGVTFVIPARRQAHQALTGGAGNIGVRIPGHPVAAALVTAVGIPITGTSANLSGAGGCWDIENLPLELIAGVDLILDAGPLAGGPGSTVVDVSGEVPVVLREGRVAKKEILANHGQYQRKHIDIGP